MKRLTTIIFFLFIGITSASAQTTYTQIASGDFNTSDQSVWDISGYPTATDLIVCTTPGLTLTVPTGFSAEIAGGDFGGSSDSNRATLRVEGSLKLFGDVNFADYAALYISGTVDVQGNWFECPDFSGKVYLDMVGTATNRAKLYSSIPYVGGWGGLNNRTGLFNASFADVVEIESFKTARSYNNNVSITDCVLDAGDSRIELGWYLNDSDFVLKRSDILSELWIYTVNASTATGSGLWDVSDLSLISDIKAGFVVRSYGSYPGKYLGVKNVVSKNLSIQADVEESLIYVKENSAAYQGVGSGRKDKCLLVMDKDNPHTFNRNRFNVDNAIIDIIYSGSWTDFGDHGIVPANNDWKISNSLILEAGGGVLMNALGDSHTANYECINNTLVGNYDNFYGALARTESGGTFEGTLKLLSNIVYSRTQPSKVFLFEGNQNQITELNNNCYFGFTDVYGSVDNTGDTAGVTVGLGDQDIQVDPQFVDPTRTFVTWSQQEYGLSAELAIDKMVRDKNGFDPILKTQILANKHPVPVLAAFDWIKAGYAPQNPALEFASHTGGVIGAIAFESILSTDSENFDTIISIHPNPTSNIFTIDLGNEILEKVIIYNELGQKIKDLSVGKAGVNTNEVNISNLSNGIYFVKITSQSGKTATKKIIKN